MTADGGCDGLINCAAHYRWWTRDPELYHTLNEAAVSELMALALEAGVQRVSVLGRMLAWVYRTYSAGYAAGRRRWRDTAVTDCVQQTGVRTPHNGRAFGAGGECEW